MAPMAKIGKVNNKLEDIETKSRMLIPFLVALDTPPAHDELDTAE
jgi:hypothetical protein